MDGRGRPWRDHRQVINGVLRRLRTGAPWRDLPKRYGPWQTVYERFARREADGTWARLLEQIQVRDDSVGAVSGRCRSTPRSAGPISMPSAPAKGAAARDGLEDPARAAAGQALGRSRGGLTSKVRLACDGLGLPLADVVTPGNINDSTVLDDVLNALRVPRTGAGLVPGDRPVPAHAWHPYDDPGAGAAEGQPCAARPGRRQTAGLRPRASQGPQGNESAASAA
ncbi:IS5 family transposase [Streptomyces griseoviridis]|uniref:IS5 family transposase n=1 Tax=Streptomyces griseoviridis TaxID=45398 RepID=UPI0033E9F322